MYSEHTVDVGRVITRKQYAEACKDRDKARCHHKELGQCMTFIDEESYTRNHEDKGMNFDSINIIYLNCDDVNSFHQSSPN